MPEMVLAVSLLAMSVVWSVRVALAGGPAVPGPRTPHLIAAGVLFWTAASIVPLGTSTAARLSAWSAWGRELNRQACRGLEPAGMRSVYPPSWTGTAQRPPRGADVAATVSIDPAASRHELRKLGCYYLFFVLTMAHLRRRRDVRTALAIVAAVAVAEAIVGGGGILSGSREYLWLLPNPVDENHRHFGTFVNANHAGTFLGVGLVLWMLLALLPVAASKSRKSKGQRRTSRVKGHDLRLSTLDLRRFPAMRFLMVALAGAALAVGLFLTNSHGALVATAVPLLVLSILFVVRKPPARLPLILFAAVALAVGLAAYRFLPEAERTRQISKILDRKHWLAGERPLFRRTIWEGAFAAAAVAPWCGSGPGTFLDAYRPFDRTRKETIINSAHNLYLDVLVEQGLVGVGLTILGIGWLVSMLRRRSVKTDSRSGPVRECSRTSQYRCMARLGLGAALAVLLLHSAVDFSLQIPAVALVFVALIAAVARSSPTWKPPRERSARKMLVPLATVVAAAVLAVSSFQPLLATVLLANTISLQRKIEGRDNKTMDHLGHPRPRQSRFAAARAECPTPAPLSRLMEHACALQPLRFHNSRSAAYGLKTRMCMWDLSGSVRSAAPGGRGSQGSIAFRFVRHRGRTLPGRLHSEALLRDAMEMVRTNPFCVEARLAAATAAAHTGNARAALALADQAQRLDRGHAETYYAAGRALLTADLDQHALIAFADSLNISPRFVYDIAECVRERGLHNEILALAIDDPRSLCWLAMNLPEADTSTRQHVVTRLEAMLDGDRGLEGRADLRKLVSGRHGLTEAQRLYLRGQMALWLEDRPVKAIRCFEQSLAIEPLLWIRWHLAQAYRRVGREAEADEQLIAISKLNPNYTPPEKWLRGMPKP